MKILTIFQTIYKFFFWFQLAPLFRGTERSDANVTALNETLEILDTLIGSNLYLVGEQLTIADITTAVTISNGEVTIICLCSSSITFKSLRWNDKKIEKLRR